MDRKSSSDKKIIIGCLCAIGCEIIYGFSYVCTKGVTNMTTPLTLMGWRFMLAFVATLICVATGLMKINLKGKSIKPVLVTALLYPTIYFIGETYGVSMTTASESGALLGCLPIGAVIASTLILKEKPSKYQLIGILITLIGVLITVFAVSSSVSFSAKGYLMLAIAVVSYSLYCVRVERATDYSSSELTFVMLGMAAIVFAIMAVIEAYNNGEMSTLLKMPFTNTQFALTILYQGIGCSLMACFLANTAIATIGANGNATFIGICTALSVLSGILILHEPFNELQVFGVVAIVGGVYIANRSLKG